LTAGFASAQQGGDAPARERSATLDGFAGRVMVSVAIAAIAVAAGAVLWIAADVFLLAFAGVLVAIALGGLADAVAEHTGVRRRVALAAVAVSILAMIAVAGWLIAPPIADQMAQLFEELPRAWQQLRGHLENSAWGRAALSLASPDDQGNAGSAMLRRAGGTFAATLGWTVGGLVNVVVVLFVGLYVAIDPGTYRRGLLRMFPRRHRGAAGETLRAMGSTLRRWLLGKVIGMALIGGLTAAGLALVGIPLAPALGVVAGLLNFVPYLGPVLSFVSAARVALLRGSTDVAWVLALYVLVQGVESYLVTPLIQQRAVSLPPALIVTGQILFSVLFGGLGLMLATPIIAAAVVAAGRADAEVASAGRTAGTPEPAG
jgi:predicted PurR-regulated permease PerM